MFERIIRIVGEENFKKLEQLNILLIGVGGVGGSAFECLVRSGIRFITIIDNDIIEKSNLNRQIFTNFSNIGSFKIEEAKKRALLINPNCQITVLNQKLNEQNIKRLPLQKYDYILDACDDILTKKNLIQYAKNHHISFLSCMGTANRLDPQKLKICKLSQTKNDPLAKKLRNLLRKEHEKYLDIKVVCSDEIPIPCKNLGTICSVPMTAGSIMASYVINDCIKKISIKN